MAPAAEDEVDAEDDWEAPPWVASIPELHLNGFDGPMDLLLDLALELVEQFVAAMAGLAGRVTLDRQADLLVLTAKRVLLRSRLMVPASPEEAVTAEQDAALEEQRLAERLRMRAAAAWLEARPQLGRDVFERPMPRTQARTGTTMALMEACLAVLRGPHSRPEAAPVYWPALVRLWRVEQALARIRQMLAERPQGGELRHFLPAAGQGVDQPQQVRGAMAGTFVGCLELARQGEVTAEQEALFEPVRVRLFKME